MRSAPNISKARRASPRSCSSSPAPVAAGPGSRRVRTRRSQSSTVSTGCAPTSAPLSPVCIAVDDAQWADSPSLRFLSFLLTRLEGLSIAVIAATRPREAGADAGLLAALATDPSAEVLHLAPLTRTAVAQFVADGLGASPDPGFVDACLQATGGTPFLMRELVGALRADGVAPSRSVCRARRADRRADRGQVDLAAARPASGARGPSGPGGCDPGVRRPAASRQARRPRRG